MKNIKQYREDKGLTQFELASKAGLKSVGNVSGFESFSKNLTWEAAQKVAKALGVSTQELFINHHVAAIKEGIKKQPNAKEVVKFLVGKAEDEALPREVRMAAINGAREVLKSLDEGYKPGTALKGRYLDGRKKPEKPEIQRDMAGRRVK